MSPWFRRKRKQDEQRAAEAASAPVQEAPPEAVAVDSAPAAANGDAGSETGSSEPGSSETAPKRRRGNRGGRGRRKPGSAPLGEQSGQERPEQAEQAPRERKPQADRGQRSQSGERSQRQERRANQQGNRRRVPQKRAPLPKAKRELLISVDVGEQRVAILEDDRVAEVYLERPDKRSIAGNIYLGTVDNVLPGMEAAFVEIGLEKNGFLYVDEIVVPELEGKRHGKKITDLIARGQEILVQSVKDPMKTKGARLTTEISLPGRFLVFVPQGEGLGVSRRLDDAERARLKEIIKGLEVKEGGIIVRTAAEGASAEDIERDLVFLQRLWKTIQAKAKTAKAPALVYQEAELPLRIVRDLFAGDFESAQIDHDRTFKRIVGYLKKTSPHMLERVHRYKEKTPLFEGTGVDAEIRSTLSRRVDLPSGGYLIFDYAEAFTVVDVNTGRFVGSRSKSSGARLEDTITKNNLEAVKEVVRQLRLRDIGGIIVIDFIDMANPKNRAQVEEALRNELERDRTKTYVVEISPLGLVEMTRQNVTDGPREILTKKCPTCEGDGIVVSEATAAMDVERRLRGLAAGSRAQAFRVEVNARTAALLIGSGANRLTEIEAASKKRFFFVPKDGVHSDHLAVLAEGKLVDLQPETSLAESSEVDVKLVELGLHDASTAVGKLDGVDVIVGGAAKLVGKKAKVRIERGARRLGLRDVARRRCGRGARCDHLRERGREADPRAQSREEGRRGDDGDRARGRRGRARGRGGRSGGSPRGRGAGDRGRGCGGRRGSREEEDAPWLTRRPQPQEAGGRRRGRLGRRHGRSGHARGRRAGGGRVGGRAGERAEVPSAHPRAQRRAGRRRPREAEAARSDEAGGCRRRRGVGRRGRRSRGRDRCRERRRGGAGEEEDAPRLAWRTQPEEEAGRRRRERRRPARRRGGSSSAGGGGRGSEARNGRRDPGAPRNRSCLRRVRADVRVGRRDLACSLQSPGARAPSPRFARPKQTLT